MNDFILSFQLASPSNWSYLLMGVLVSLVAWLGKRAISDMDKRQNSMDTRVDQMERDFNKQITDISKRATIDLTNMRREFDASLKTIRDEGRKDDGELREIIESNGQDIARLLERTRNLLK
jgi:biopolymer transport protein ExbB/TolQ